MSIVTLFLILIPGVESVTPTMATGFDKTVHDVTYLDQDIEILDEQEMMKRMTAWLETADHADCEAALKAILWAVAN